MSDTADLGRGAQRGSSRKKKSGSLLGRPDRFTLLLVAAAALGAGLVLLRLASYGPGLWWDGINYITIARNLLAGDGFVDLYHEPMVLWPPLYPAMLAGGGLFGIDPYSVAGPLNAVILGLTVLVAGWWLRRYLRSRILWLWGCFSVALALPLVNMASQALSESAFILFATLSLTQIDAHLKSGSRASLILAAAFSALACLTRYMGASLILAALPMLLAARVAPPEKMKRIALYGLIAAAPLGLWMLRNFLVAGSTTGGRDRAFYSFSFIADEALQIATADWWLMGLTAPVLLALVIAACHAFLRRLDRKSDASSDVAWGPLCVLGGFALAYLTLLVVAMMSGGTWSGLQWRFLAPVYVPLLFAALLLMDGVLRYAGIVLRRRGVRAIAGRTLAVALMLALSLQVAWLVTLNGRELQAWNAGERQEYDVYLRGNRLIYRNRSCIREDENDTRFPLSVYLLDAESGTPERAMLDFEWHENFWKNNGTCVAERQLPDKDLFGIRTGQVDRYGNLLWEVEHWFEEKRRWFDGYWSAATSGEPAARSTFDIYIGENTLTYAKQPCAPADTEAMFFLHGIPIDPEDLPDHRQQYGFDNLDFYFDQHGESFDGKCLAKVPLPEYGISGIRTGQYVPVYSGFDNVWEAEFRR